MWDVLEEVEVSFLVRVCVLDARRESALASASIDLSRKDFSGAGWGWDRGWF